MFMVQDTKEQNLDQKRYIGEIISYLPEKHYGFIRSDDGKELFFLDSGVKYAKDLQALKEKVAVSFLMQPTNKSFKALEVEILKLKDGEERYEVPLEVMIYQEEVDGRYKLLKDSYKYVIDYRGTSINEVVYKAQSWATHFGCNALHHARLIRRTAQELTPSGMRYYTEFRYIGSPCFVGAKSVKGTVTKKDIPQDLDKKLQDYYVNYQDEALDNYIAKYKKRSFISMGASVALGLFGCVAMSNPIAIIVFLLMSAICLGFCIFYVKNWLLPPEVFSGGAVSLKTRLRTDTGEWSS